MERDIIVFTADSWKIKHKKILEILTVLLIMAIYGCLLLLGAYVNVMFYRIIVFTIVCRIFFSIRKYFFKKTTWFHFGKPTVEEITLLSDKIIISAHQSYVFEVKNITYRISSYVLGQKLTIHNTKTYKFNLNQFSHQSLKAIVETIESQQKNVEPDNHKQVQPIDRRNLFLTSLRSMLRDKIAQTHDKESFIDYLTFVDGRENPYKRRWIHGAKESGGGHYESLGGSSTEPGKEHACYNEAKIILSIAFLVGIFISIAYKNLFIPLILSSFVGIYAFFMHIRDHDKQYTLDTVAKLHSIRIEKEKFCINSDEFNWLDIQSITFTLDVTNHEHREIEIMSKTGYSHIYFASIFKIDIENINIDITKIGDKIVREKRKDEVFLESFLILSLHQQLGKIELMPMIRE